MCRAPFEGSSRRGHFEDRAIPVGDARYRANRRSMPQKEKSVLKPVRKRLSSVSALRHLSSLTDVSKRRFRMSADVAAQPVQPSRDRHCRHPYAPVRPVCTQECGRDWLLASIGAIDAARGGQSTLHRHRRRHGCRRAGTENDRLDERFPTVRGAWPSHV